MRIVIDGRYIRTRKTGIGIYTEHVVRELTKIGRDHEFILIVAENPEGLAADNLRVICLDILRRRFVHRIWENVFLPSFLYRVQADVYFSPLFFLPLVTRTRIPFYSARRRQFLRNLKLIVTVHDVIPLLYPEVTAIRLRWRLKYFLRPSLQVADLILTDSSASKMDIMRLFDIPEKKVHVIPLGKSERFRKISDPVLLNKVREEHQLPESFILYVGTVEPRKNLGVLIGAYARMAPDMKDKFKLVIAGHKGWRYDQVTSLAKRHGLERDIHFIGYVSDEHLPALFSLANLFVYPSLYEGFGLPVLEAMACGLPVVVSNSSSLPEVVGDAGILFDPSDDVGLATILETILTDSSRRERLAEASLVQAQRFSWRATAQQILHLLHSTYSES